VTVGPSSPVNNTQQPGVTGLPVLQISVNNPSAVSVTLTSLVLTAVGSGNDMTGIDSVVVYADMNNNGVVDGVDVALDTVAYPSNNGSVTILFSNNVVPPASSMNVLVVDNFSPAAPDGTYQAIINSGGLSGTSAYGDATFNGLPVTGAVITIMHSTETPSFTPTTTLTTSSTSTSTRTATVLATDTPISTTTPTLTSTWTPLPTDTPSPTATLLSTETESPTWTETPEPSFTPTPIADTSVVIYPNPSDGSQPVSVHMPGGIGTSDVTVQIFTVAFRLVQLQVLPQLPLGTEIQIELKDKWGHPLASGLYYVVVATNEGRHVAKLLILR
jgi:hypothetical protein